MSLLALGWAAGSAGILPASVLTAHAPSPETRPHLVATFDQMPKTVTLPDGTLFAFFHPIKGEMREATARTSNDGGHTWSELRTLFTLPEEVGGFGYTLPFIGSKGELHLFLLCDANSGAVRPAREPKPKGLGPYGKLDIWHARTTDGRRTWQPPRRIWEGRAGDLQSVIQLRSGRILLPISYYIPGNWANRGTGFDAFSWMGNFRVSALYSDDGGTTWQQSPAALKTPTPAIGDLGAIEPVVIQLQDGRVWMLIRTQLGRFYESFSKDGIDWTPAQPTSIESSDSPAGLVRLKDGRILLFVNDCRRFPYADGGRQVLHVALSSDEGRTWSGWREVLRDPHRGEPPPTNGDHGVSYPYLTLAADGKVLFSMWVETGLKRSLVTFDPRWLDETSQVDDFSQGAEEWSIFGTQGVEVIDHPAHAGVRVLRLRKTSSEWSAAAVRNFPAAAAGHLRLRLLLEPGHCTVLISLTDHCSTPFDDLDEIHNLYNLAIDGQGHVGAGAPGVVALEPGRWHDLELRWDTRKQQCLVSVDGKRIAAIPQSRISSRVNYLRLKCTSIVDHGGFLVESVETTAFGGK
jgi:hypothetical protein